MKKTLIIISALVVLCVIAYIMFWRTTNTRTSQEDMIRVDVPAPESVISSPLYITGEARGPWYFEASFPVRLLDASGTVVAEHYAEAQDSWMTEDFVPFEATLSFDIPDTATGTLVLEKANASGLPEYADELRIPVMFTQ